MIVMASYVGQLTAASVGEWFIDWATYARAVGRWLAGVPIYPADQLHGPYNLVSMSGRGYAYPPASVPLMTPFALGPFGLILWEALLLGLYLSALWAIVGLGFPHRRWEAFGAAMLATALFTPGMTGFVAGNVNIATAGLIGWAWVGLPRSGIVAGIFGVVKIFPMAVALLYGWRAVVAAALTASLIALVTVPLVGVGAWADFVTAVRGAQPTCASSGTNLSLVCLTAPTLGSQIATILSFVIAGLLFVTAAIAGPTLIGVAAVALGIMAPAADLHGHYWSLILVVLLIAIARLARLRRGETPDPAASPLAMRWRVSWPRGVDARDLARPDSSRSGVPSD